MAKVKLRFVGLYYSRDVEVPDGEFEGRGPTVERVMDLCDEQDPNFFFSKSSDTSLGTVIVRDPDPANGKIGIFALQEFPFSIPQQTFQYYIGTDTDAGRLTKNVDNNFVIFSQSNRDGDGTVIAPGDIIIWRLVSICKRRVDEISNRAFQMPGFEG
jgi:hypothetical protein